MSYSYAHLDQKSIEKVKKELNERPDHTPAHIESFRRWIKSQPHLTCPLDDAFLLRFLRVAKFDHEKAERRLDNFCTVRGSPRVTTNYFTDIPAPDDPIVQTYLSMQHFLFAGKLESGELVLIARMGKWNPDLVSMEAMGKQMMMNLDLVVSEEAAQMHGVIIIVDLEGGGRKQMEAFGNQKLIKTLLRCLQDAYPIRIKLRIIYKEPAIFDIVLKIIEFFSNEKLKKRTLRLKDNLKKMHDRVPGIANILPQEYGGSSGTVAEAAARFHQLFRNYFANGSPLASIKVDESRRPAATLKFLKEYGEYPAETLGGTQGTYTKLSD